MAVDRGNAEVAYLYSAYNPAVLRSIERVIKAGRAEESWLVCVVKQQQTHYLLHY